MRLIWCRQAARALERRLDGGQIEQQQFVTGEPEAVGGVGVDLVAVEPGEMVADDEALGERFVCRHGEARPGLGQPTGEVPVGLPRSAELTSDATSPPGAVSGEGSGKAACPGSPSAGPGTASDQRP